MVARHNERPFAELVLKPLVLYHGQCLDGFAAAWVAFQRFGGAGEYHAIQFGEPLRWPVEGRDVLILDFSFPRQQLIEMKERASSLLVLDHHLTAQQDLAGLDFAQFDLTRAGCTLTWDFFFPGEPRPWLLGYVEDKDLWRWKLPDSQEVSAALQSYSRSFKTWDKILKKGIDALVAEGRPILRYKNRLIETAASRVRMTDFEGHRIPVVTSCVLQSEIGGRLAPHHPFVAIVFETGGRRIWSLRSHEGSGINVAEIAKRRGGGGHPNAAGFIETIAPEAGGGASGGAEASVADGAPAAD
ncbi:MAG: phosphoesterase [Planctomycetes bacterium]|nr:phosphoesterase [Planctomycetota bacterium]